MHEELIKMHVDSIAPLTDSVLQLMLVPESYVNYQPGQYLQILCRGEALSYSIANAPLGARKYELHIRHSPDNASNQALLSEIKNQPFLMVNIPFGDCFLAALNPKKPILFIAGGTGFAPIKAMIEQLLADSDPRHFELYWQARSQSDLYLDATVEQWQSHVKTFRYFSLLSSNTQDKIMPLLNTRYPKGLSDKQIVISGPFDMVYSLRDSLVSQGISPQSIFSDAFSFEQKKE